MAEAAQVGTDLVLRFIQARRYSSFICLAGSINACQVTVNPDENTRI